MFIGIISGAGRIVSTEDHDAIRTFVLEFPARFCEGLTVGASVSVDGVCLTITKILSPTQASLDVIFQTLKVTTLSEHVTGQYVNVERAARDGAEIGGHPLSGHIDFSTSIMGVSTFEGNKVLHIHIPDDFKRYIFPKGYIAVNGTSLTVAEVDRTEESFEVWLIPETRRVTTFDGKVVGDRVNVEIERNTQVVVDTIRGAVREEFVRLGPALEQLLVSNKIDTDRLIDIPRAVNLIARSGRDH